MQIDVTESINLTTVQNVEEMLIDAHITDSMIRTITTDTTTVQIAEDWWEIALTTGCTIRTTKILDKVINNNEISKFGRQS